MDIRRYFGSGGVTQKKNNERKDLSSQKRKSIAILDSDDEESPLPSKSTKREYFISDSDDDIFEIKTPKRKIEKSSSSPKKADKSKPSVNNKEKASKQSPKTFSKIKKVEQPKLKPTSVSNFFGPTAPAFRSKSKIEIKSDDVKEKEFTFETCHEDEDFENTLKQLKKPQDPVSKCEEKVPKANGVSHKEKSPLKANNNTENKKRSHEASPVKNYAMKNKHDQLSQIESKEPERRASPRKRDRSNSSQIESKEPERRVSPRKRDKSNSNGYGAESPKKHVATPTKPKDRTPKKSKSEHEEVKSEKKSKISLSSKLAEKARERVNQSILPKNHVSELPKQKKSVPESPKLKRSIVPESPEPKKKRVSSVSKLSVEKSVVKTDLNESLSDKKKGVKEESNLNDSSFLEEEGKRKKDGYLKFLQRAGPKNHGSKELPEGKPSCLSGLTFVLSGVCESFDREELAEVIKKYGGKVTTSVSKKTSYLVVGDEAGESKLKKAESCGTKTLDEDGLLNLVSTSKAGKSVMGTNGSTTPSRESIKSSSSRSHLKPKVEEKLSSDSSSLPSSRLASTQSSSSQCSSLSSNLTQSSEKSSESSSQKSSNSELMWVDKYKPTGLKGIIGQQGESSNAKKLLNWLRNWTKNQTGGQKHPKPSPWAKDNTGAFFKAALLSGPPGVGKTTTAFLACKELGYDVVELNASDTRSKRSLDEEVAELLTNTSLKGFVTGNGEKGTSRHHVLLMDEVDGMSGNQDRGGVQELIGLIKKSKVPIVCMCNDRNHPKIRSLANHCFDLRYNKPNVVQIRGAMMSVCYREGVKIKPEALDQIIIGSNHDIRQVLNHISVWSANQKVMDNEQTTKDSKMAKKEFKVGPWDVCKKVFDESAHASMSIHDKVSLFFQDYSIGPLFVQENYYKVAPHCARGKGQQKTLDQLAKTANILADGDLVEKQIRSKSAWGLLPTQALYSSVLPGNYMAGHFSAQIEFPAWLGKNSRRGKFDRLAQELHMHMRLRVSCSKRDLITSYCPHLRTAIVNPLVKDGIDGIEKSVDAMTAHDLIREDLDSLIELANWPGVKDPMNSIETKVKAAFTRTLNKDSHMSPYAIVAAAKKVRHGESQDDLEGEEDVEGDEEESEDVSKDAMIKVKKSKDKEINLPSRSQKGSGKGRGKKSK